MSISLDGFVAGPDQSRENPLGIGGLELHHWHLDEPLHEADVRAQRELMRRRGAYVMDRNMFAPSAAPGMVIGEDGGERSRHTTRRCSSSPTIRTSRSRCKAGRLFDGVEDPGFEPLEIIHSPRATHVRYRIGR
jgi:hypothetical protein